MDVYKKTILITGASRGIGKAIAIELASHGAKIIGVARNLTLLEQVMTSIGGVAVSCDLSDSSIVRGLIDQVESTNGPIDILINNAGVDHTGLFRNATSQDIYDVITTNQITPIDLTRQALHRMSLRGSGHIVNISSLSSCAGFAGMTLYSSSKSGLSSFHRVLRHELNKSPISLTLVELGPIPTDMLQDVTSLEPTRKMFNRLRRLQMLPEVSVDKVAKNVRLTIEHNRKHLCLPRRAKIYPLLTGAPQKIVDTIMSTIAR